MRTFLFLSLEIQSFKNVSEVRTRNEKIMRRPHDRKVEKNCGDDDDDDDSNPKPTTAAKFSEESA